MSKSGLCNSQAKKQYLLENGCRRHLEKNEKLRQVAYSLFDLSHVNKEESGSGTAQLTSPRDASSLARVTTTWVSYVFSGRLWDVSRGHALD